MFDLKEIMSTKAQREERGTISIRPDDIPPRYSSLTDYLDRIVGGDRQGLASIDSLVRRYHLGAARGLPGEHYGTVLPRIDRSGRIAGGCVVWFDFTSGEPLRAKRLADCLYQWYCYDYYEDADVFFGEHTLSGRPVAVVQEEKTALLGALGGYPLDWLAVGFGRRLTAKMIDKLRGRQAILFPNGSFMDDWEKLCGTGVKVGTSFVDADINDYLAKRIQEKGARNGQ